MSLKNRILDRAPKSPPLVELKNLPEWGEGLFIKRWSAAERDAYESRQSTLTKEGRGLLNFRARFVAGCLVDAAGVAVFAEEDEAALGALPLPEIDRAFRQAIAINGLGPDDEKELAKNS